MSAPVTTAGATPTPVPTSVPTTTPTTTPTTPPVTTGSAPVSTVSTPVSTSPTPIYVPATGSSGGSVGGGYLPPYTTFRGSTGGSGWGQPTCALVHTTNTTPSPGFIPYTPTLKPWIGPGTHPKESFGGLVPFSPFQTRTNKPRRDATRHIPVSGSQGSDGGVWEQGS